MKLLTILPQVGMAGVLTALWLAPAALAQSAASLQAQTAASAQSGGFAAARQLAPEQMAAHLDALQALFSIRQRQNDPFGQLQDPAAKPKVVRQISPTRRVMQSQATPFRELVRRIKVTTVMPAERRFLIGGRTIRQGEQIPLSFRGKKLKVQVTSVSSSAIAFRNLENGEQAELKLDLMPVGMSSGRGEFKAPGMEVDRANAPIELDSGSL